MKSRDYFTGAFGGTSTLAGETPPVEKDIWGSATKKGSFDVNGKFVVEDDDETAQPLEPEDQKTEDVPVSEEPTQTSEERDVNSSFTGSDTFGGDSTSQISDNYSLPSVGGRA